MNLQNTRTMVTVECKRNGVAYRRALHVPTSDIIMQKDDILVLDVKAAAKFCRVYVHKETGSNKNLKDGLISVTVLDKKDGNEYEGTAIITDLSSPKIDEVALKRIGEIPVEQKKETPKADPKAEERRKAREAREEKEAEERQFAAFKNRRR